MREANRIVSKILDEMGRAVEPGVTTMVFEEIAQARCRDHKVRPAFQGYGGFPYALCCSVNEEVVHGFPSSSRVLQEGDIVSFDMGVIYQGFYGDSARTFGVGKVSETAQKLMDVTRDSLMKGIRRAQPGHDLYEVSRAIQEYAEGFGFGVVRRFVGHGIGSRLHEKPEIPNFVPSGMPGLPLKPGMTLSIEPMITEGSYEVEVLADKWTAVTKDRKLSAHFEHTIVVTKDGPVILSRSD